MVPTTSLALSPHWSTTSLFNLPVHAQLYPSSGCISMPSSLTVLAKEAQAHWKPHGATQSQPRGERDEGGWGKRSRRISGEKRNLLFSCLILGHNIKSYNTSNMYSCVLRHKLVSLSYFFSSHLRELLLPAPPHLITPPQHQASLPVC